MQLRQLLQLEGLAKPATWLVVAVLLVSFIGFLDASYLSFEAISGEVPPCPIGGGCEKVTTSPYSRIAGVPIAVMGAAYYLAIFIATILYVDTKRAKIFGLVGLLTVIGFLFSTWLLFVQSILLEAYCTYCLFSALTSYTLFALALYYRLKQAR